MTNEELELYKEIRGAADKASPHNILKFIDEYYPDEEKTPVINQLFIERVVKEFDKLWYNGQLMEYNIVSEHWKSSWDPECEYSTISREVLATCALSLISDKYFDDMIKIIVGSPYIKYVVECRNNGERTLASHNNGIFATYPIYFLVITKDNKYEDIEIDYLGGFSEESFMSAINPKDGVFDYSLYHESTQGKNNADFDYNDRILNILKQYEKSVADIVDELPYDRDVKTQLHKYIWSLMYYQISN